MGKIDKVDSLFREWLGNEPDWGWDYIRWSDFYWLWNLGNEKDFAKEESILGDDNARTMHNATRYCARASQCVPPTHRAVIVPTNKPLGVGTMNPAYYKY